VYSLTPYFLFVFRPELVAWRQVERICALSDPYLLFVFRPDLVDWRQVERTCVLYSLTPYLLFVFRPDLVDWRQVERRQVRERIDLAFHVMDREYGVTRLLDPEGKPRK
jgi:hypothetical protein